MPNFAIERRCAGIVCGIDEVGRGPLAGPVVAAAVILDQKRFPRSLRERLDDSKVLTIDEREACWKALGRCVERGAAHIGLVRRACAKSTRSTFCARHCWRWRAPSLR